MARPSDAAKLASAAKDKTVGDEYLRPTRVIILTSSCMVMVKVRIIKQQKCVYALSELSVYTHKNGSRLPIPSP